VEKLESIIFLRLFLKFNNHKPQILKKLTIILLSLHLCTYLIGQENRNLEDHPGQLHFNFNPPVGDINYKYTNEQELKIKAKQEAIVKYIQTNEGFSNLKGVEIYIYGRLIDRFNTFTWLNSIPSQIHVEFHPWYISEGKIYNKCIGCGPSYFTIFINTPHYLYNGQASPAGSDIYDSDGSLINLEPNKLFEKDGAVFYENGTIVISKPGVPLYVPLTVRQYDMLLLKNAEKNMREKPEDKMTFQFLHDKLKEEMAQFSEAELDKPAWQYAFGGSPEPMGEGVKRIVKINKAYFDPSKPITDTQLIIIDYSYGALQNDPENPYFSNEYSSFQHLKQVEAMKTFKFSGMFGFLE